MYSALILVISVVALLHFSVWYWRALMAGVACEDLSEQMRDLTSGGSVGPDDFFALVCMRKMCPDLAHKGKRIGLVSAYYRALSLLRSTLGAIVPSVTGWANREMATCSRYVAVVTDQRLRGNQAQLAQIHSY